MSATPIPRIAAHVPGRPARHERDRECRPKIAWRFKPSSPSWDDKLIQIPPSSRNSNAAARSTSSTTASTPSGRSRQNSRRLIPKAKIIRSAPRHRCGESELEKVMLVLHASRSRHSRLHHHHRERPRHPCSATRSSSTAPTASASLELYQLRGRVGCSNRRAYAYLVNPEKKSSSPPSRADASRP